jgi:hypothetical protein
MRALQKLDFAWLSPWFQIALGRNTQFRRVRRLSVNRLRVYCQAARQMQTNVSSKRLFINDPECGASVCMREREIV